MRILLVEDSVAQAGFIQHALGANSLATPFKVVWAETLERARETLAATAVDLILLDLLLPDSEGLDTFTSIRAAQPEVPIIVLSGTGDESTALRAVADGAQDYLPKNSLSPDILVRSIRYAVERDSHLRGLQRVALSDDLTGVYNRRGFLLLAGKRLDLARRTGSPIAMVFVDVDGLKKLNDTYGHQAGDQALADLGRLMESTFRTSDIVGRLGGDEFCALLMTEVGEASSAAARLHRAIADHNASAVRPFVLSCSVGTITHQANKDSLISELVSRADQAMYDAKSARHRPLILIVDDDPARGLVHQNLLSGRFEVVSADTGRSAIELAARENPSLVLLDLGLADMDSQQVMAELRRGIGTGSIPIIATTPNEDHAAELDWFRAGVEAFLVEPIDPDDLLRSVDLALGQGASAVATARQRFDERQNP